MSLVDQEILKKVLDYYLFKDLKEGVGELDNAFMLRIYKRIFAVYDDDWVADDIPSVIGKLNEYKRWCNLLDLAYLIKKPKDMLEVDKFLRIVSAIMDKTEYRYNSKQSVSARCRAVMKRFQRLEYHSKFGKENNYPKKKLCSNESILQSQKVMKTTSEPVRKQSLAAVSQLGTNVQPNTSCRKKSQTVSRIALTQKSRKLPENVNLNTTFTILEDDMIKSPRLQTHRTSSPSFVGWSPEGNCNIETVRMASASGKENVIPTGKQLPRTPPQKNKSDDLTLEERTVVRTLFNDEHDKIMIDNTEIMEDRSSFKVQSTDAPAGKFSTENCTKAEEVVLLCPNSEITNNQSTTYVETPADVKDRVIEVKAAEATELVGENGSKTDSVVTTLREVKEVDKNSTEKEDPDSISTSSNMVKRQESDCELVIESEENNCQVPSVKVKQTARSKLRKPRTVPKFSKCDDEDNCDIICELPKRVTRSRSKNSFFKDEKCDLPNDFRFTPATSDGQENGYTAVKGSEEQKLEDYPKERLQRTRSKLRKPKVLPKLQEKDDEELCNDLYGPSSRPKRKNAKGNATEKDNANGELFNKGIEGGVGDENGNGIDKVYDINSRRETRRKATSKTSKPKMLPILEETDERNRAEANTVKSRRGRRGTAVEDVEQQLLKDEDSDYVFVAATTHNTPVSRLTKPDKGNRPTINVSGGVKVNRRKSSLPLPVRKLKKENSLRKMLVLSSGSSTSGECNEATVAANYGLRKRKAVETVVSDNSKDTPKDQKGKHRRISLSSTSSIDSITLMVKDKSAKNRATNDDSSGVKKSVVNKLVVTFKA